MFVTHSIPWNILGIPCILLRHAICSTERAYKDLIFKAQKLFSKMPLSIRLGQIVGIQNILEIIRKFLDNPDANNPGCNNNLQAKFLITRGFVKSQFAMHLPKREGFKGVGGRSRVKNTSWAYITLILVVFRKCKNSKYFSRYREKCPMKIV